MLPFADEAFDISFFHFVLLWLADPVRALIEARRVTRPGGAVIAFAEPDYSLRVPTNPSLAKICQLQVNSLRAQGADPDIGSRLGELFPAAGIQPTEYGQLQIDLTFMDEDAFELELDVLKSDVKHMLPATDLDQILAGLHETKPELLTFLVPTFFCWGWVI